MKRRPEKYLLKVAKGCLVPADGYTQSRLKGKYRVGDIVLATLAKPRTPGFHRLAHVFAKMISDNIDGFVGMDAHAVLKRLQWESGIGCEEIGVMVPGVGYAQVRLPRSLSFASMDQGEFEEVFRGLARHVASNYWSGLTEDQIIEMAEIMPEEV